MKVHLTFSGVAAVVMCLAAAGCGRVATVTQAESRPVVRVTTAFGPFTNQLIQEYEHSVPQFDVKPIPAADSVAVVRAIESGNADLGLAYADAVYEAYATAPTRPSASIIRGVSVLEPLPLYLVVGNHSGIEHPADLKGKRIIAPNWGLGDLLLRAAGVDLQRVTRSTSRADVVEGFSRGKIDAALIPGWVQGMTSNYESLKPFAHVLAIEGDAVEHLRRHYPFVRTVTIPRVLYPEQEHPIKTIGMDVLVVCRRDLPESVVYTATKDMFIAYPRLANVEATLRFLNLDEAAATPIPLHPGAARYFRERELSR